MLKSVYTNEGKRPITSKPMLRVEVESRYKTISHSTNRTTQNVTIKGRASIKNLIKTATARPS